MQRVCCPPLKLLGGGAAPSSYAYAMLITSVQSFKLIAYKPWEELITQTCYPTLKANFKLKPPPPPVIITAGRPKAAFLFWFFGDFRCGALLFMVIHVIYKYKNR